MNISSKRIWREVKIIFLLLVLSTLSVYVFCPGCWSFDHIPGSAILQSGVVWLLLAYGNGWINHYFDRKISWIHQTYKRLIIGLLAILLYTVTVMYLQGYFFLWLYDQPLPNPLAMTSNLLVAILITALATAILFGRSFLLSWREAAINQEKLKRENIQSRFESLKNQLNPHFLFNSLNVLAELVYLDQEKSVHFIQEFSGIYRYVLENRENELVPLRKELVFLDKFFFLQKIRFQEALQVEVKVIKLESYVPPMALQLLVENAIKHNIVSKEEPLSIQIIEKQDYIEVSNNYQPRKSRETSSGVGLPNIKERYSFLSQKEIQIEKNENFFIVRLPILNLKDYASTNY